MFWTDKRDTDDDSSDNDIEKSSGSRRRKGQVTLIAGELRELIVDEARKLGKKKKKPAAEALNDVFAEFDVRDKGAITGQDFNECLDIIGFDDLTKKQRKLLLECFDLDGDASQSLAFANGFYFI